MNNVESCTISTGKYHHLLNEPVIENRPSTGNRGSATVVMGTCDFDQTPTDKYVIVEKCHVPLNESVVRLGSVGNNGSSATVETGMCVSAQTLIGNNVSMNVNVSSANVRQMVSVHSQADVVEEGWTATDNMGSASVAAGDNILVQQVSEKGRDSFFDDVKNSEDALAQLHEIVTPVKADRLEYWLEGYDEGEKQELIETS